MTCVSEKAAKLSWDEKTAAAIKIAGHRAKQKDRRKRRANGLIGHIANLDDAPRPAVTYFLNHTPPVCSGPAPFRKPLLVGIDRMEPDHFCRIIDSTY
jgi:hypothetical protein